MTCVSAFGFLMILAKTVKQNISDLSKMMMNTRRLTSDNMTILD
jgi:hypothetical protein